MTLAEALAEVWNQVLVEGRPRVNVGGEDYAVRATPSRKLRTVDFDFNGQRLTGIEQNRETRSRWAELARQGQRVMQFSCRGRYIGNVAEGRLTKYSAWQALELAE